MCQYCTLTLYFTFILGRRSGVVQVSTTKEGVLLGYQGYPFKLTIKPDASLRILANRPHLSPVEVGCFDKLVWACGKNFAHHNMIHR